MNTHHFLQFKLSKNVLAPLLFLKRRLAPWPHPLSTVHHSLAAQVGSVDPTGPGYRLSEKATWASPSYGRKASKDLSKHLSGLYLENVCRFIVFLLLDSLR